MTLHLKPEDTDDALHDYTNPSTVREHRQAVLGLHHLADPDGAEPARASDGRRRANRDAQLDEGHLGPAAGEVTEEEYHEFYHHVTHDWTDPLDTIRLSAEGTFEYQALLFLPVTRRSTCSCGTKRGVQLYVKRVFIMDDCEALMPQYLRFVKGVVDAHDLSLNVSREILQKDRQIQVIRKRLVKKVLSTLRRCRTKEPEEYATFWSEFGRAVKEGLLVRLRQPGGHLEICSFPSTHDAEKPTTLREYVGRMQEGQDTIYFPSGESRAALENSPLLEAFRAKGYEVLLFTDPVDEVWLEPFRVRGKQLHLDRPRRSRARRR